jgi:NAD(P)-dependent dehydrogenase (short-subunit alcohol dehydrogenase family)
MSIKGKTALVTGAATGIGLETVKALLKNGAQVSYIG